MTKTATVSINGQDYDAVTGLPVKRSGKKLAPATKLHSSPQRSQTLRRRALQKPQPQHAIIGHKSPARHMDIARPHKNANIHKFAPHPVGALKPKTVEVAPPPAPHPHVVKAHTLSEIKSQPLTSTITAKDIKEDAIKTAVGKTRKRRPLKSRIRPRQRLVAIFSASLAVVMLGGYFTYLNMPSLSVRVAAAQAGIDANYPDYRPDGYALNGPVKYSDGRVSMNFKANAGMQNFTISQSKSSWDSTALLDNYVSPKAGFDYIPYTERGLTIYTYDNNAAWVNGGILYTIEGDAPLSSDQIRRIATSLL